MKYRQKGYKDSEGKSGHKPAGGPDQAARDAARQVRHGMERASSAVLRCADCGHQSPAAVVVEMSTTCEKCGTALHNCRNCRSFDSQARFQCRQPIEARLESKIAANDCGLYEARVELDATGRRAATPSSARSAFDDLFKK